MGEFNSGSKKKIESGLRLTFGALQRLCHTLSNAEIGELLEGIKNRLRVLGASDPEMATVDNCCKVRSEILKWFPEIHVLLDVYHFLMR